ncbi:MAG: FAD-binding oxidoreductase [Candidatus Marinimicrobia bacterium]|nr:FAD-binding oxidoreductase [Candidatus Neomarinimicrobiota bacterium]MBL7029786.1 FAD-binding oxidoreductase [Candidatus Neomarinimicrobiota bacterium]
MNKSYDVIIIGGGIIGTTSAFHLAKNGVKVAILEQRFIGDGPTGKSSAIIRQHYSNEVTARMAHYGVQVFQQFESEVGGECGYNNTGFFVIASKENRPGLLKNLEIQKLVGIRTKLLSNDSVVALFPGLILDDSVTVVYEPDGGYADAYLTANSFAQAAKKFGADIYQKSKVLSIRRNEDKVIGVDSTKGQFDAPVIICCTGAWTKGVCETVDLNIPINPCRVQVAYFKRPPNNQGHQPVVTDFINETYFRSEGKELTLAGLIDPAEANAIVDPDQFNESIDIDFVEKIGRKIIARYPDMVQSKSTGGYASLYAVTPDWHPIVDEIPAGSGYYVCAGFSGHGFKLSPAVGLMVSEMVTKSTNPTFDHRFFRFSRFEENMPIGGSYDQSIVG